MTHKRHAANRLFDHLVGALLKKPRYVEAECLGSLEVDEELEFGR
jgi:hypothetical protein